MPRHTMPLPGIPELVLPSFRELDESIEANRRHQSSSHLSNNMYEGTKISSSLSPQDINVIPNPYPPYPANGWLVPPDFSQNAFRELGFTYQDQGPVGVLRTSVSVDREINPVQLPLRLKESQPSPSPTQSTLSSAQTTLPAPLSTSTPISSTPENVSPDQSRQILTNRQPSNEHTRRKAVNHDAAANHRAQRRRVGVTFSEVAAHTAKCDVCNKRNKNGMARCQNCGWQICRKCLTDRSGDQTHASFGATHVPQGGGGMPVSLPSVDGNRDARSSESKADMRAAQTLLELGLPFGNGNGTPSSVSDMASDAVGPKVAARDQGLQRQVDALSTNSDMTLPVAGDEEWPQDESDVPIGEDGLPLGYVITRRNPARAARPSTKMAE